MNKRFPAPLLAAAFLVLAFSTLASGQGLIDAQRTRAALSSFPDSQAVLFVNLQRLVRDAAPRILPPAEFQKALEGAKSVGIDLNGMEYAIIGARFAAGQESQLPEVVMVVRGSFNADTLLMLARLGLDTQGIKSRQDTYGSRTLNVVTQEQVNKDSGAAKSALPLPYKEFAATALDSNTLVVGVPAYVRATIDAAEGKGGMATSLVDLATRNPNALVSLTAQIPESLPQMLKSTGAPIGSEAEKVISWLRQMNVSLGMTALNFDLQAAIQTDAPEHASALSGLVRMGITAAETALKAGMEKNPKDKNLPQNQMALNAIRTMVNNHDGSVVNLSVSVPQKTILDIVKREMSPPATKSPQTSRPAARRRATRRR